MGKHEKEKTIEKEEKKKIEKHSTKNSENNKNKKINLKIAIGVAICFLTIFSTIFSLLNINSKKIITGINILDVDVSNMTREQAIEKISMLTEEKLSNDIILKYENYETTINPSQVDTKLEIENAVDEAYKIGRDGNIIKNNYDILLTKLFNKNMNIDLKYNEELMKNKINDISSKLPNAMIQNSYYIEDEKLIIVKGQKGNTIKEEEFINLFENSIKGVNQIKLIELPIENRNPDEIDVEQIRKEIYREPENAYIKHDPFEIHPNINGVDFDLTIEEAKKIVEENKSEYEIPLKITIADVTVADLGEEAFPDRLSTYTTYYNSGNYNRSNNLELAAKKINGTVILPGEIFSYNQVVGERTISAGYKEAGAYAGGKVVQSVGGGICQTSSTLYNAALLANLEITDRSNHCFETGYVDAGRDATVSWGTLDFKFKNTRKYPIKVVTSAGGGEITVSIYGLKEEVEYDVEIESYVTSYIPYSVQYEKDNTLEEGKEIIEQSGFDGCNSEAYRILKLNGEVIKKELLSKDTYDPMERIIIIGTKKAPKPTAPVNPGQEKPKANTNTTTNTTNNETTNSTENNINETPTNEISNITNENN